jgi:hypothetical protein
VGDAFALEIFANVQKSGFEKAARIIAVRDLENIS